MPTQFTQAELDKAQQDIDYARSEVDHHRRRVAKLVERSEPSDLAFGTLRQAQVSLMILETHREVVREGLAAERTNEAVLRS